MSKIYWQFEDHDYSAAESYLLLLFPKEHVDTLIAKLKAADIVEFKAKDIERASGLKLLGKNNFHVAKDLKKIKQGKTISPILLVRDYPSRKLIIADGFHRLGAIYVLDEDALVQCKII